ncbi:MAG: type II toxin-antitoxin system HicB family antitoxin [Acidobacteria bacterium]|nr:type II toxin-antitoxin system HicB family antitoxin [Acidobacteriota bacterium]MBE3129124.1 type II toxin-antitoxin system HicB family antitoxin [Acidobacteriota bacterium]
MARYLIIIEKAEKNYSAYSPDLPGCVAAGKTRANAESNMKKAIEMHIRGLRRDNQPLPEPRSIAEYVQVG